MIAPVNSVTKIPKTTPDFEDINESDISTSPFELPSPANLCAVSQVYDDGNTAKSDLASSKEPEEMITREELPLNKERATAGGLKRKWADDCKLGSSKSK